MKLAAHQPGALETRLREIRTTGRKILVPYITGGLTGWIDAIRGAAVGRGTPGVVHGMKSYLMQDEYGQVQEAHSISAGLDYPGVGPEHSYLASVGRAEYPSVNDQEVIEGFKLMARAEGIIPALECAHAVAWITKEAPKIQGQTVLMNLSGRGDKDVAQMMTILGDQLS